MILAGFTVPEGERFEIPAEGHLAWFGQTQLSGKTTALEAFIFRGHLKAIAFITKRGEGSFLTGHMIQPYFSEPTNDPEQPMWRWVKSILEASQQRRMNFEESWIIRACEDPRQAKTLADVHANIKTLLAGQKGPQVEGRRGHRRVTEKWIRKPVTGMNAGVYTSLKAYFDIVMPQLARLPYTTRLELGPGLNVMDLREYAMETQALVIRSVMEWVYQHERNVRVIVPEAQDFVPQGKNTPVKMACETLVRKGGADRNFMWLDSQDMAAVDKVMLRACSIVGCGVQTEIHEIDRTLSSMFTPHLRPLDVAKLKTGQFFVRLPEARVAKIYVQPAWMDSEPHAQAIARGEVPAESAKAMRDAFAKTRTVPSSSSYGVEPRRAEKAVASELDHPPSGRKSSRSEIRESPVNAPYTGSAAMPTTPTRIPSPPQLLQLQTQEDDPDETGGNAQSDDTQRNAAEGSKMLSPGSEVNPRSNYGTHVPPVESEDAVWKEKYEELKIKFDALEKELRTLQAQVTFGSVPPLKPDNGRLTIDEILVEQSEAIDPKRVAQFDEIYREIKHRAARDGSLELLVRKPELHVKVERHTLKMDSKNLDGAIARLVHIGFFDTLRDREAIAAELRRRGALSPTTNLKIISPPLAKLVEHGFLTRESDTTFRAVPEMKTEIVEHA